MGYSDVPVLGGRVCTTERSVNSLIGRNFDIGVTEDTTSEGVCTVGRQGFAARAGPDVALDGFHAAPSVECRDGKQINPREKRLGCRRSTKVVPCHFLLFETASLRDKLKRPDRLCVQEPPVRPDPRYGDVTNRAG